MVFFVTAQKVDMEIWKRSDESPEPVIYPNPVKLLSSKQTSIK